MKTHLLNRAWVYEVSLQLARVLPLGFMRLVGRCIGFFSYYFSHMARRNVINNLRRVVGDPMAAKKISRRIFLNYGAYLADWAKFVNMDTAWVFGQFHRVEGEAVLQEAIRRGKGMILLTAHLGNWELGGIFFSHAKIPINIVTAQDEVQAIANIRERIRGLHHVKTITIGNAPFFFIDIINALKRNEIVAMLIERYDRSNGILVPFFGEPAYFPPGPVQLARATGAAVIPAFTVMDRRGRYLGVVEQIIDMEFTDNKDNDARMNLEKIVKVFERYISAYADQWYNFSPIWYADKEQ